ncbi:MAG: NUDIX domain-containing protein [Jatrophihabitantaceae bacterium]
MDIRAAAAIVFDDRGRLLMVRRGRRPAAGSWSIPGGKCQDEETTEAACVRECAEETGLTIKVERLAGRVWVAAGDHDQFVIDDYLCRLVGGRLQAGDDADLARWVSRAEFDRLDLIDGLAAALADWDLLPD